MFEFGLVYSGERFRASWASCFLSDGQVADRKAILYNRVATVREKYLENEIFSRSEKVGEFGGWPGKFRKDLESQGKVREFENKWL